MTESAKELNNVPLFYSKVSSRLSTIGSKEYRLSMTVLLQFPRNSPTFPHQPFQFSHVPHFPRSISFPFNPEVKFSPIFPLYVLLLLLSSFNNSNSPFVPFSRFSIPNLLLNKATSQAEWKYVKQPYHPNVLYE